MSITDKVNELERNIDNSICSELRWTKDHFKILYKVAEDKGILEALKYDIAVTSMVYPIEDRD